MIDESIAGTCKQSAKVAAESSAGRVYAPDESIPLSSIQRSDRPFFDPILFDPIFYLKQISNKAIAE